MVLLHSHIQLVPELSLGGRLGDDSRQNEFEQALREDTCMQNLLSSGVVFNGNASLLTQARRRLYGSMKASSNTLKNATPDVTKSSNTIQGLSDIFSREGNSGAIHPILHPLDTPVRAIVLPITDSSAVESITRSLNEFLPKQQYASLLWYQNLSLLHSTLYHASTHLDPVPATEEQIEAEYSAIVRAATDLCPVIGVLDSVVFTDSGTLLALWHVAQRDGSDISSEEPANIRNTLRQVLPRASKSQVVHDDIIFHTTLARLAVTDGSDSHSNLRSTVATAASAITAQLCGLQARLDVMWYVEEYDVLALALNGRLKVRNVPLKGCTS